MFKLTEIIAYNVEYNLCLCGCGQILIQNNKYYIKKYINGHGTKNLKYELNNFCKYLRIDSYGYILIRRPNHPFANHRGYVFLHRLIYEKYYNCILLPFTIIHHIDGNIYNNSIENLMPLFQNQHRKLHCYKSAN